MEDWTSLPAGAGRAYHGCALINKTHLIIAGGRHTYGSGPTHLRSSWVLDMVRRVWSQASDLQVRRDETVLTNVGGRVVAIAGYDKKEYWQQLEEFQPSLNRSVVRLTLTFSYLTDVIQGHLLIVALHCINWKPSMDSMDHQVIKSQKSPKKEPRDPPLWTVRIFAELPLTNDEAMEKVY